MLDRGAAACRKTSAVSKPVHFVDNWRRRVAGQQKIAMQRVRRPRLDRSADGHERLRDHEATEDALPSHLRTAAAEDIILDLLER